MKKIIKKIVLFPTINRLIHMLLIRCHNTLYSWLTHLAVISNKGIHPKHEILKYNKFFIDQLGPQETVIDIGCGIGHTAYAVAEKVRNVTAIDISAGNIKFAQEKFHRNNIKFLIGDATTYKFDQRFDAIILSNVLEHIDNRVQFLEQLHQISNKILIRVPMVNRDWLTVYKKNLGFEYRLDRTHFIEYIVPELISELKTAGWKLNKYSVQFGELWGIALVNTNHE